jgi:hypothetical protein
MTAQTAPKPAPAPQTPPLPQTKPQSLGLSAVRLHKLSDAFKRDIDKGTIPGVTMMVARRGQIGWFEALGRQNPAAAAPMALNSIFRIFSMTKPIVSVGIMTLLEEGYLLLNDPVAKYIPEFSSQTVGVENNGKLDLVPLTRPITVQDLLRHTSGITYDHTGNSLVQQLYQQSRTCRDGREPAADVPAGRGMELQPLHRHSRPHHRSRFRQNPKHVPDRADSGAAANGRDRVPYRARKYQPPRRTVCGRSVERREGAALQHAGTAGDGIRRRRAGLDVDGLRAVLPDAAQWRHTRRQQDHRPQDAAADGQPTISAPRSRSKAR